ncbi:uncharacterized protein LOC112557967 isoform X1 [Pomacea canaliculata]|uniref:uncharacterized protein LOC112557967 isoform X1 n=1 Tax=Pomacea canaliculata TaxID=400727 RepID=UPI000D729A6A|nr:uncharacterized protein LOC112557967 isoform X1 [Pomacea canaliculata]
MFDKMAFPFIPSSSSWVLCPLLLTINNTCWILGYELVCILTITLRHLFHQLAVGIADHRLHNERFVSRLGDYSNLYVDLSRVTCLVDRYLRVIMAVAVFINSVIAVFVNYIILKLNLKVWVICVVSAWFSVCAIVFLATSVLCSRVESKAKAPLQTLLRVQSASKNPQHAAELNLFIQTIIHGNVGISVMDLFVITKGTILTIVSVVVSYFFVIIQLNI